MSTPRKRIVFRKWLLRSAVAALALVLSSIAALEVMLRVIPFSESQLADQSCSRLVTDRTGQPLSQRVGDDDHWRYPVALRDVSPWIIQATIASEDKRFRSHGGVDWLAVVRAAGQNISAGRTESGASTLTMQVCRMMDDRPRTWRAKMVEAFRALQLERRLDKDRILETYLNMAPYGGNIRGVEAAARRYFGKSAADVSLTEAALLAGLPQAPTRLRPDRHPDAANIRRATVLQRMADLEMISAAQHKSAAAESINLATVRWTPTARHAAQLALTRRPAGGRTTVDPALQAEIERLVLDHAGTLPPRTQIAVVIIDIASAEILSLVGSVDFDAPVDGQVNGAIARRSPGSALKPFVYAAAFEDRRLSPESILHDVPVNIAGWSPRNFDRSFTGEISAADALRQSLNIPAVLVAQEIGLARVVGLTESAGVNLSNDTQARAGLGVVVGAAEVTLLDLTNGYATLGRGGIRMMPRLFLNEPSESVRVLDANVCAALDDILSTPHRRPKGMEALAPADVPWFMWKTGTSALRRDAWAIGHNRGFAVGVWVGRFAGAGSPSLVGAEAAEPLLADIFNLKSLRTDHAPAPAEPWPVHRPIQPPPERQPAIGILTPDAGAIFIAVNDHAVVHLQANRARGITWFLNDRFMGRDELATIDAPTGAHVLRCVDLSGAHTAVSFVVKRGSQARR